MKSLEQMVVSLSVQPLPAAETRFFPLKQKGKELKQFQHRG